MGVGAKPKPTRLKIIQGNPGKRPLNKAEPKIAPPKNIKAPDHLSPEAKKEYRRTGRMLQNVGVLTQADMKALELYAETYSNWLEAVGKVQLSGLVVKSQSGTPKQNPYLTIANQSSKIMQSLLADFGMTPSSRSRITVSKKESNEFDDL